MDREDDEEREYSGHGSPNPEVAEPDVRIVDDLDCELDDGIGNDEAKDGL